MTVARLLSGIGAAWVFSCGSALVAGRYRHHADRSGTATGLFFAGAGLGIALSGLAVNPLLARWGVTAWPQAWLLLGLVAALLSIWPLREARRPGEIANATTGRALSVRGSWMPLLGYFVFAAGYIVYMTFILAWMRNQGWSWQLGLGVFIAPSSGAVLVRRTMPPDLWAKGMTLFTVVFALGQAIGPVAAGWIADVSTLSESLLSGIALLLIAALLPLLGMVPNSIFRR